MDESDEEREYEEDRLYSEHLNKVHDASRKKVDEILAEAFGERAASVLGGRPFSDARQLLIEAHREEWGEAKAVDIAFHMTDWKRDAADILALHLFPEKFSPEEAQWLVMSFLIHAPSHIRAACILTEWTTWTNFEMPEG